MTVAIRPGAASILECNCHIPKNLWPASGMSLPPKSEWESDPYVNLQLFLDRRGQVNIWEPVAFVKVKVNVLTAFQIRHSATPPCLAHDF